MPARPPLNSAHRDTSITPTTVTEHALTEPADPLSLGDPDGYGRYGVLEEQPSGLVCHECGRTFPSLGLHAYRGHGMTASTLTWLIIAENRPLVPQMVRHPAEVRYVPHACAMTLVPLDTDGPALFVPGWVSRR